MWTKIIRALRLAALEVKTHTSSGSHNPEVQSEIINNPFFKIRNECHIWDRIDKKTSKLKTKAWDTFMETQKDMD